MRALPDASGLCFFRNRFVFQTALKMPAGVHLAVLFSLHSGIFYSKTRLASRMSLHP
ncbi:hypothetical protein HMPREF9120_00660 [Neisseria sp. oral taxon 020 str. F0370]|nr:hypothetical protein HMPREF9120_00660 [Neisseria sp. oral taxon 020 str. F0370]